MDIWKEIESLAVNFDACHKTLTAMGDETRQHIILEMMRMDYNGSRVIDIAATTNLSRPAVSHHLQILKDAGTVTSWYIGSRCRKRTSKSFWNMTARYTEKSLTLPITRNIPISESEMQQASAQV